MSLTKATATAVKSGSTVTAEVNGTITTVQVVRGLIVTPGDVLLVEKIRAEWYATALLFDAPPLPVENERPPEPKPAATTGSLVVSPVETRSYRNSSWRTDTDDVYQGEYGGNGNHTGSVFYGSKPNSLDGATVTGATIKVKRVSGGTYAAQSTTMRLMTQKTRPGGVPTLTSTAAGPSLAVGASTTFTIPASWAQSIVDGTAGGIAFFDADGSPYVRFAGRGSWSAAFTLTINWTRSS